MGLQQRKGEETRLSDAVRHVWIREC